MDVGTVRIGVAGCDPDGILATPIQTLRRDGKHLGRLVRLVAEQQAVEVIVGLPRTLADRVGSSARDAVAQKLLAARRLRGERDQLRSAREDARLALDARQKERAALAKNLDLARETRARAEAEISGLVERLESIDRALASRGGGLKTPETPHKSPPMTGSITKYAIKTIALAGRMARGRLIKR